MRAEVERAYRNGGLAAATGVEEEEEFVGPPRTETVDQILKRVEPVAAGMPIRDLVDIRRQQSLQDLKLGQQRIAARRAKMERQAEQDRWLALAQGMLAPTRTGGFGESLGTTAGLLQQQNVLAAQREEALIDDEERAAAQKRDIENQYIEDLLGLEKIEATGRKTGKGTVGGIETVELPEDKHRPVGSRRLGLAVTKVGRDPETGETILTPEILRYDDGSPILAADSLDPVRRGEVARVIEQKRIEEKRSQGQIDDALTAYEVIKDLKRAGEILTLPHVTTSGLQEWKNAAANFLGVDFGDTVELTELQGLLAQDYLDRLAGLKGSTSDKELGVMKSISLGLGKNPNANWIKLKRMQEIAARVIKMGVKEAYDRGDTDTMINLGFDPSLEIVTSQEQYDELPSGTVYYQEVGGQQFTKP